MTNQNLPTKDITTLEMIVNIIYHHFDKELTKSEHDSLARMLGHNSSNSGAFNTKLADLRKYGLLEGQGEKQLTSVAEDLVKSRKTGLEEILNNIPLLQKAYEEFNGQIPSEDEWSVFVDGEIDSKSDELDTDRIRKQYISLVGQLPPAKKEEFSAEKFERYYSDLNKPHMREISIESIRGLSKKELPSIDKFDKLHSIISVHFESCPTVRDPPDFATGFDQEHIAELLKALERMTGSSTTTIKQERGEELAKLAIGLITETTESRYHEHARKILDKIDPASLDRAYIKDIWEATLRYFRDSFEGPSDGIKEDLANKLLRRLLSQWADQTMIETMEEDIYAEMKGDIGDEYRSNLSEWHYRCRDELDMT
jgi:hypothetical protein